jgi:hypothetical protein
MFHDWLNGWFQALELVGIYCRGVSGSSRRLRISHSLIDHGTVAALLGRERRYGMVSYRVD